MKTIRGVLKVPYYFMLNPLYTRMKAEAADEARAEIEQQANQSATEIEQLRKEVERLKKLNLEHQGRIAQQVADEFVKMYQLIEDIKCDRAEVKLNVTLVNELVKIHQSIEALKHDRITT